MRRLFGRKKEEAPKPTLEDASERLANRSAKIDQEIEIIDGKLKKLMQEYKTTKSAARKAQIKKQCQPLLRRKKMIQNNQERVENQRMSVDQVAFNQEMVQTNIDTMQAMKSSVKAMKSSMKSMRIEDADDLMLDMEDLTDEVNGITEILGQGVGNDVDEAELDAEFEALEDDLGDANFDDIEEPTKDKDEEMPSMNF